MATSSRRFVESPGKSGTRLCRTAVDRRTKEEAEEKETGMEDVRVTQRDIFYNLSIGLQIKDFPNNIF